jgi:hypothetical protein
MQRLKVTGANFLGKIVELWLRILRVIVKELRESVL